ncbi:hypothetical protein JNO54_01180 [Janibacter sp. YIM B02568]|uniref:hypothetical protein n=1 Tax=Janibacter endophyticus TaxID=2806261 RepID=UPI00194DF258|nr:hypothetical protein [Janibacter endophyticus]MBM6544755.1 hypothetical protein [Janibacter endophyticus]
MDLDEAVTELYAAPLEEFVAVRTRLAQAAGRPAAAEIKALRKPTVTAWLLNQLAREHTDVVATVDDLGRRMRAAQAAADMTALRELRPERDAVLRDCVAAVRDVAEEHGRSLSQAGADEVSATVIAALADVESQAALASGMLVKTLSYSGFGEVDIDDAVATRARLRVVTGGDDEGGDDAGGDDAGGDDEGGTDAADPDEHDLAASALARAEAEHARVTHEAQVRLQTAEAELAQATTELQDAEAALAAARERASAARQEARRRGRERDAAAKRVAEARRGSPRS